MTANNKMLGRKRNAAVFRKIKLEYIGFRLILYIPPVRNSCFPVGRPILVTSPIDKYAGTMIRLAGIRKTTAISFCTSGAVSYTHLRAHETRHDLVCRLL